MSTGKTKDWLRRFATMVAAMLAASTLGAVASAGPPAPGSPEFGPYVMRLLDDQFRGSQSQGVMEMKVQTARWARTMSLETWSLGTRYSLVRILSPAKERGTATLKVADELFTYLNKTGKTIKITSGMMGSSWMGSHFTNDDLVRHWRLSESFTIKQTFTGRAEGTDVYRFTLTPKDDAAIVWGKVVVTVRQADLQPVRQAYFDEDGTEVRQLTFSELAELGGKVRPTRMVMRPLDGSGEYTQIDWKKLDLGVKLTPRFFSLERLKSLK
jgi:hypothetical protein